MSELGFDHISRMQKYMQEALVSPSQSKLGDIEGLFIPSKNLSAKECLAIYQRGYILRLAKCLAEQFPALCHALGGELFDQFARQYIRDRPPVSYTLYDLGRRFSTYLDEERPDKNLPPQQREGWIDFMVDLASFERLHFCLFDAPGHEGKPWPCADLPDKDLILQPCFELDAYRYPVAWYYHTYSRKPDLNYPDQRESYVAILRKDYLTSTFPINRVHYLFLKQLQICQDITYSLSHVSRITSTPLEQVTHSWQKEVRERWVKAGFFIRRN